MGIGICSNCGMTLQDPIVPNSIMLKWYSQIGNYANPSRSGKPSKEKVKCVDNQLDFLKKYVLNKGNAFQVNMVPLRKYGTLEFRAHSGTYDHERIARWVQFVIAFVEHFGAEGTASTKQFFSAPSWEVGYERLATAQRSATIEDLFKELEAGLKIRWSW